MMFAGKYNFQVENTRGNKVLYRPEITINTNNRQVFLFVLQRFYTNWSSKLFYFADYEPLSYVVKVRFSGLKF